LLIVAASIPPFLFKIVNNKFWTCHPLLLQKGQKLLSVLDLQAVKGDGCHRKIKHILEYHLEMKDFQDMFEGPEEPTIRLYFAEDGRQTSKKIGLVMDVFSVLQDGIHKPDYQLHACIMASFHIFLSDLK